MFKVYVKENREYFEINGIKKDFELTQSLTDLLYIDFDNVEINNLFQDAGKAIKEEEKDKANLLLDEIGKLHVYFELLKMQEIKHYKDISHIPSKLYFFKEQFENRNKFHFSILSTKFDKIAGEYCEVLYPNNIYEIIEFFMRIIFKQNITFKICRSCGKYFADIGHGNSEYCNRFYQDSGKTCKEIGSTKVFLEKISKSPEYQAYSKAYKTQFARIRYKKITKDEFQEWANMARKFRDQVTNGTMTMDEFRAWLRK